MWFHSGPQKDILTFSAEKMENNWMKAEIKIFCDGG